MFSLCSEEMRFRNRNALAPSHRSPFGVGEQELLLKTSAPNLGSHAHPCISLTSRRSGKSRLLLRPGQECADDLGPVLLRCPWIKLQWRRGCTVVASALALYCSLFNIGSSLLPCCCCSLLRHAVEARCVMVDRIQPLYILLYISLISVLYHRLL